VPTVLHGSLPTTTSATLYASGGTSGIVADNTASPGSEVYYSELGSRVCVTGGTGGCAVQATQSGLN
jgi:hypothetical protein